MFECCNILRIRPPREEYKPYSTTLSSTFFLPAKQFCLLFPPSGAFVGTFSWPGIILLLSSKPDLSSARLHLGFSVLLFSSVLTLGRESCQCAWPLGGLRCFLGVYKPLSCAYVVHTQRLICCRKHRTRSQRCWQSLCVQPWTWSPFLWASVSPSVRWRVISSMPVTQLCGQELNLLKCVKMCFVICSSCEMHVCGMRFWKSEIVPYTEELYHTHI